MGFFVKRYVSAVSARRAWFLLALIPPLVYLALAAGRYDRYTILQDVTISKSSPVSSVKDPISFFPMEILLTQPDDFFTDTFALRNLVEQLAARGLLRVNDDAQRHLRVIVARHMSLEMPDANTAQISYNGDDPDLGKALVGFFAARLVTRATQGLARMELDARRNPASSLSPAWQGTVSTTDEIQIRPIRSLWRPERLRPTLFLLFVALAAVLFLIGVSEWTDPSFKSERQVARYLEVPLLGSLPDLDRLSALADEKKRP